MLGLCTLDQGAPEAAKGGADILVSSMELPVVSTPIIDAGDHDSGDGPEDESTDILKEWASAIDQRCGPSASDSGLNEAKGLTADRKDVDVNEPEELFMDPSNQRVIAVFPDKKRRALGALSFLNID